MQKLSVVVPCYNEVENIDDFYAELMKNNAFFEKRELDVEVEQQLGAGGHVDALHGLAAATLHRGWRGRGAECGHGAEFEDDRRDDAGRKGCSERNSQRGFEERASATCNHGRVPFPWVMGRTAL